MSKWFQRFAVNSASGENNDSFDFDKEMSDLETTQVRCYEALRHTSCSSSAAGVRGHSSAHVHHLNNMKDFEKVKNCEIRG